MARRVRKAVVMLDRTLLALLSQQPISGEVLAGQLGVGRSAVWKRIQQLRDAGLEIETKSGQGYFLKQAIEWLDEKRIRDSLSAEAKNLLGDFYIAQHIDSTNSWAKTQLKKKAGSDIFLAEQQTAGRGRLGRRWTSPVAANIYLSIRRRFNKGLPALSGLSLVVGLLLAKTLRAQGFADVGLKWPNDIYVGGNKKCGGILIEVSGEANSEITAVIGIGLNVKMPAHSAKAIDQAWTDLQQQAAGSFVSRNKLLVALINELLPGLQYFEDEGPAVFLSQWPQYDVLLNQKVKLLDGVHVHVGQVLGITEHGALRLQQDGVERHYHSGEISVRPL
jgi:BirA family transcriptional regulator, biotin operon repressor / biotin---[acetyl-CoA-carboxylase] ligase